MKYLLECILVTIILFFVWNSLKRMFFTTFYKLPKQNNPQSRGGFKQSKNQEETKQNLNWDAETVDYEEVKEEEKLRN